MARQKQTVVAPKWPSETCSRKNNEEEHGALSEQQQTTESKICKPVCLSSDTEITGANDHGLRTTKKQSNPARSFYCTACGKEIFSGSEIHEHPTLLGVGICSVCKEFLFSGPFTKDKIDGFEEQCRWCGEGGTVVMCDYCPQVFCETCIVRNFGGRNGLLPILAQSSNWKCFCCNPEALSVCINDLKEFRNASRVPSRLRNHTRESSSSDHHASDENRASSIADIIHMAQSKQKTINAGRWQEWRNQNNGIRTTSRNKNSREKSTTHRKRAGTLDRDHYSSEVKRLKPIEKQQASCATAPAKTYIRPHQVKPSEGKGKETEFINYNSECAFDKTPRNNLLATFTPVSRQDHTDCVSEPEMSAARDYSVHTKMVKLMKEAFQGLNKLLFR